MKKEDIKIILWVIITACIVALTLHIVWPEPEKKPRRLDIAERQALRKMAEQ